MLFLLLSLNGFARKVNGIFMLFIFPGGTAPLPVLLNFYRDDRNAMGCVVNNRYFHDAAALLCRRQLLARSG